MDARSGKPTLQRQLQVSEQLRHVIAEIFERGQVIDPDVYGRTITVTEVRVSPDYRNATVFVVPLGGGTGSEVECMVAGLNRAAPFIRKRLAGSIKLRRTPKLTFTADQSFDGFDHIEKLLKKPSIAQDLNNDSEQKRESKVEFQS